MTIVDKVIDLMNIDLIKDRQTWKNRVNEIKQMIEELNYSEKETKMWRTHIDYQLFKSLDF